MHTITYTGHQLVRWQMRSRPKGQGHPSPPASPLPSERGRRYPIKGIVSKKYIACSGCPFSDSMCYLVWFSGALVVAIACVTSRSTGWTDFRLRTSIRRPRTCYIFFTDYIVLVVVLVAAAAAVMIKVCLI